MDVRPRVGFDAYWKIANVAKICLKGDDTCSGAPGAAELAELWSDVDEATRRFPLSTRLRHARRANANATLGTKLQWVPTLGLG